MAWKAFADIRKSEWWSNRSKLLKSITVLSFALLVLETFGSRPPSSYLIDHELLPFHYRSDRHLKEAIETSEEIWQRSVKKRKQFIESKGGLSNMNMFTRKGENGGQDFTLWDIFVPAWNCPWEIERLGKISDGGKYTCGLSRIAETRGKDCVVYSFGVEWESSWEAEILERTDCEIYMFDFSVDEYGPQLREMPESLSQRAHFYKYGLGEKDEVKNGNQFYTLQSLMLMFGHKWIDILKVDVEGAEFHLLSIMERGFGRGNLPFGQLLLEIHADRDDHPYDTQEFGIWWEGLEDAGLRAYSSEINYPSIHWLEYPIAMEMNFINNCLGNPKCGTLVRDV